MAAFGTGLVLGFVGEGIKSPYFPFSLILIGLTATYGTVIGAGRLSVFGFALSALLTAFGVLLCDLLRPELNTLEFDSFLGLIGVAFAGMGLAHYGIWSNRGITWSSSKKWFFWRRVP